MRIIVCIVSILTFVSYSLGASFAFAAEHPGMGAEHPGTARHEHPGEHPGKPAMLSAGQIIKGIKGHIKDVTAANDGVFPLYDAETGSKLRLKLVKVHEDKVSYIKKDDAYFACTDFITEDGKAKYDVDFWMKKGTNGKLAVYKTMVHKKDGKARFTYKDDEIVRVK